MGKKQGLDPQQTVRYVQKLFKQKGAKALDLARKEILEEKIECKEIREALTYFMMKYWRDMARPSIISLVCEAVGGNLESTTSIAVPMILISGAIDIHDDIIDQSKRKDGRLTIYGKYGKDIALLAGDALLFKGLMLLGKAEEGRITHEKVVAIMNIVKDAFFELGDAEALELKFRGVPSVSPQEYLHVVRKKAADVEGQTRSSAILAGASLEQIEALGEYGRSLGVLNILRDDWLDILDVEEMRSRIMNESLPLPLLFALQDPRVESTLKKILRKENISRKDAARVSKVIQKTDVPGKYAELMSEVVEKTVAVMRRAKVTNENLEILLRTLLL